MSLLCGTEINQGNVQVISLLCSLAVFTSPMFPLTQEDCTLSIDAVYRLLTNGVAQISQATETSLYQVSILSVHLSTRIAATWNGYLIFDTVAL